MRDHDPYAVLGVAPTATQAQITRAYRRLVRALHPDTRNQQELTTALDSQLGQVVSAYALLRSPRRRAQYDRAAHRVSIPITHRANASRSSRVTPPLRAGPVRRHR